MIDMIDTILLMLSIIFIGVISLLILVDLPLDPDRVNPRERRAVILSGLLILSILLFTLVILNLNIP